ncbi:MAG: hypothetical protein JKX76_02350 [Colwellia sp.]|nr:hypothetical protein [Colwellia sp.]
MGERHPVDEDDDSTVTLILIVVVFIYFCCIIVSCRLDNVDENVAVRPVAPQIIQITVNPLTTNVNFYPQNIKIENIDQSNKNSHQMTQDRIKDS